jgi:hypothetical protein
MGNGKREKGKGVIDESLRARLAGQLDAIGWASRADAADRISLRPESGKWSAREHLAHLACYHRRFLERLQAILASDGPLFKRYRAEEDPEWPQWQSLPLDQVLSRLRESRRELVELIGRLTDAELGRVGVHPVFGALTIPQWIEFFLAHEGHHFYQAMTLAWRGPPGSR